MMLNPLAHNLLYPNGVPRVDGGLRVRLALHALIREVCPDSDDSLIVVDGELDWSGVRSQGAVAWVRYPGFPRAFECRKRLGSLLVGLYPDVRAAHVVFYRSEKVIGVLELPIPPRVSSPASSSAP